MAIKRVSIKDGQRCFVARKGTHTCCDCGLTHVVEYGKDRNGAFRERWTRDNRKTAAYRRYNKPKV